MDHPVHGQEYLEKLHSNNNGHHPCIVVGRRVEEDLPQRLEGLRDGQHECVELVLVLAQIDHQKPPEGRVKHGAAPHLSDGHRHAQERVVLCKKHLTLTIDMTSNLEILMYLYGISTYETMVSTFEHLFST